MYPVPGHDNEEEERQMLIPADRAYTRNHEWVKIDSEVVEMGITEPLLRAMGDLTALELPDAGDVMLRGFPIGSVESLEMLHEILPPADAEVLDVNKELEWDLDTLYSDPYGKGWLMKIKVDNPDHLRELLTPETYTGHCKETQGGVCDIK